MGVGSQIMNETEATLGALLRITMVINACSLITLIGQRHLRFLRVIPWAASVVGVAYFSYAHWYFSQPEVLLGVPIRVDIILLGPLLIFSFIVSGTTLRRRKTQHKPGA